MDIYIFDTVWIQRCKKWPTEAKIFYSFSTHNFSGNIKLNCSHVVSENLDVDPNLDSLSPDYQNCKFSIYFKNKVGFWVKLLCHIFLGRENEHQIREDQGQAHQPEEHRHYKAQGLH